MNDLLADGITSQLHPRFCRLVIHRRSRIMCTTRLGSSKAGENSMANSVQSQCSGVHRYGNDDSTQ